MHDRPNLYTSVNFQSSAPWYQHKMDLKFFGHLEELAKGHTALSAHPRPARGGRGSTRPSVGRRAGQSDRHRRIWMVSMRI